MHPNKMHGEQKLVYSIGLLHKSNIFTVFDEQTARHPEPVLGGCCNNKPSEIPHVVLGGC